MYSSPKLLIQSIWVLQILFKKNKQKTIQEILYDLANNYYLIDYIMGMIIGSLLISKRIIDVYIFPTERT